MLLQSVDFSRYNKSLSVELSDAFRRLDQSVKWNQNSFGTNENFLFPKSLSFSTEATGVSNTDSTQTEFFVRADLRKHRHSL